MSRTAFRADAPLSAAAKSPDDILVRAMGTDDLPHVAAIEAQSQRDPWPQPSFQAELENPEVSLPLVAVRKKEIVGYVVPWFVADEVQIANIGVKEEHRRQGLGRFLLSLVLQRAEQRRCRVVFLEVRRSNLPARRLYESLGFVEDGFRRHYYGRDREDAIVMKRNLGPEHNL